MNELKEKADSIESMLSKDDVIALIESEACRKGCDSHHIVEKCIVYCRWTN